jgi:methane monooxygenase PmoA-like
MKYETRSGWQGVLIGCLVANLLGLLLEPVECLSAEASSEFRFEDVAGGAVKLWQGKEPVLVYHSEQVTRTGAAAVGNRASYVHPIYGLDGEVITDDFPKDHYHHHGLFWGWPHVTVGGKDFDFWKMHGTDIRFKRLLEKDVESNVAVLAVENEWLAGDKPVVREEATLRVHPATAEGRLIEFGLKWTALDQAITLGGAAGKGYGGVSLRFAPREDTVVTAPSGPTPQDLLITRLPWADLSAKFYEAKAVSGAALFVDPHHPDFPLEWMTRAYGLLAAGWPGVKEQTLERGKTVTCNYGVWIHRGRVDAAKIQSVYDTFSAPATAPAPKPH